jgi:hypothetical protein
MLVAGELGLPGPDLYVVMPPAHRIAIFGASLALVVAFLWALRPLLRRDPNTRFFLAGAALSLIAACATVPSGRLLLFASFGLLGALAQLFASLRDGEAGLSRWTRPIVLFTAPFKLLLAPLLFVVFSAQMLLLDRVLTRTASGLPDAPELAEQRVVVVNAPDATFLGYLAPIRAARGEPAPKSVLAMTAGVRPFELTRSGERSLTLQSSVGLVQPGTDLLLREETPFAAGHRVVFADVAIEILQVNADGWPTEARFDFTRPLDDPSLRFMQWRAQTLQPLELPGVGERIDFAAQSIELF